MTVAPPASDGDPLADADPLCRLDAAALAIGYRRGVLSPTAVAAAALDRAEAVNGRLAFTRIDRDGALAAARDSEARWRAGAPLSEVDGAPATLKDIVWARGWPTRYGSRSTDATPCEVDAPAVANLRNAGVVFIGQTTTPEFGWKAVTDSALFGITRNPWNPDMTSGGSSGGAAAAAAAGAGVFHLGTDGGGSIRIPAAFCGVAGLKPSFGRTPARPTSPFGTVSHLGPIARGIDDLRRMQRAMGGRSLYDWNQGAGRIPAMRGPRPARLERLRVACWETPPCGSVDPEVAARFAACREAIAARVASLESATPMEAAPPGVDLLDLFHRHWFVGAAYRLSLVPEAARDGLDPGFVEIARIGAAWGAVDLARAHHQRAEYGAGLDRMLSEYDVMISPGTAIPAFAAGCEVPPDSGLGRWTEWAGFSHPINLSQHPACVIPCGRTRAGAPISLQLIAARGRDARLLDIAEAVQAALPSFS